MRKVLRAFMPTALAYAIGGLQTAAADVVETRTIEERLAVDDASTLEVVVDNVFGSIRVTAHERDTVELTAVETIRADLPSDLERARAEVGLNIANEDGRASFLVRRLDDRCTCEPWRRWDGYVVAYDIELRVPGDAALDLSTVNDGEIVVDGVRGDFRIAHVNGPVTLRALRGAGRASTVNGELDVAFAAVPMTETAFETVNGDISVTFPSALSGDLEFKTMRGEIWTDFDTTPLPMRSVDERSTSRGRVVFHAERHTSVRVASGGPTHAFETLNGDIYVREAQ